jgi:hypothetical protein
MQVSYKQGDRLSIFRREISIDEVRGWSPGATVAPEVVEKEAIPRDIWLAIPDEFRILELRDPDFKVRVDFTNALCIGGKKAQTDAEWRSDITNMRRAMDAFQGRDEVKNKMVEIMNGAYILHRVKTKTPVSIFAKIMKLCENGQHKG